MSSQAPSLPLLLEIVPDFRYVATMPRGRHSLSNSQMQTSSPCFAAFLEYGCYEAHSLWGRLHGLIAGRKINFSLVYNVSQTGSGDLEVSYRLGRGCVAEWVSPSSCSVAEARLVCYVTPSLLGAHPSFLFF